MSGFTSAPDRASVGSLYVGSLYISIAAVVKRSGFPANIQILPQQVTSIPCADQLRLSDRVTLEFVNEQAYMQKGLIGN
jgi:hypothetical protein